MKCLAFLIGLSSVGALFQARESAKAAFVGGTVPTLPIEVPFSTQPRPVGKVLLGGIDCGRFSAVFMEAVKKIARRQARENQALHAEIAVLRRKVAELTCASAERRS